MARKKAAPRKKSATPYEPPGVPRKYDSPYRARVEHRRYCNPFKKWYVLTCKDGYLGKQWSVKQNSIVSPRYAVFPEIEPPLYGTVCLCYGPDEADEEARRGRETLGVDFTRKEVKVEGRGEKQAKLALA